MLEELKKLYKESAFDYTTINIFLNKLSDEALMEMFNILDDSGKLRNVEARSCFRRDASGHLLPYRTVAFIEADGTENTVYISPVGRFITAKEAEEMNYIKCKECIASGYESSFSFLLKYLLIEVISRREDNKDDE